MASVFLSQTMKKNEEEIKTEIFNFEIWPKIFTNNYTDNVDDEKKIDSVWCVLHYCKLYLNWFNQRKKNRNWIHICVWFVWFVVSTLKINLCERFGHTIQIECMHTSKCVCSILSKFIRISRTYTDIHAHASMLSLSIRFQVAVMSDNTIHS